MKYIVKMNGTYMKGFTNHRDASEFADWLLRMTGNQTVKVEMAE